MSVVILSTKIYNVNMNNEDKLMPLAERIKYFRTKLNISQEELAFRCDLDRTYISQVERKKRNPSYLTLQKICLGLEINLSTLTKGL